MNPQVIGEQIKVRRKLLGLTQPELAERLGASRGNSGYISEIEHGKRDFGVSLLGKLADALECSASDFFSNSLVKNNKLADLETLTQAHAHETALELQPARAEKI